MQHVSREIGSLENSKRSKLSITLALHGTHRIDIMNRHYASVIDFYVYVVWLMLVGKGVNVRMLNIHLSVLSILLLPNMSCNTADCHIYLYNLYT